MIRMLDMASSTYDQHDEEARAALVTDLIDRILAAELSVEEALEQYPKLQDELEDLVELARCLSTLQPSVPLTVQERVRDNLTAEFQQPQGSTGRAPDSLPQQSGASARV